MEVFDEIAANANNLKVVKTDNLVSLCLSN